MTQSIKLKNQPVHLVLDGKQMLQGTAIGLILVTFYLVGVGEPEPAWPKFWIVKFLLMVLVAGGLGGIFYFDIDHLGL